ncbi:alpha/beta fold hydrolase [Lysobacter korlensis]|uniref:Alpha/beta fold hydrolase n=1 Tax=Lysobacter korlensis TaxID=553636 RepID=A0ABV6RW13_9GAMM
MGGEFESAERRLLGRYGLELEERRFAVAGGTGRALVGGDGQPVVFVPGGGMPAAGWAPLVAAVPGIRAHLLELPGFGLGDLLPAPERPLRAAAVDFLEAAFDSLEVDRPVVVANSMGALWTLWLAAERPSRVSSLILVGCPALLLGTSAPPPMRLLSVAGLGPLLLRLQRPSERQLERTLASAGIDLRGNDELRDLALAMERLPHFGVAWTRLLHAAIRLRGARPQTALTAETLRRIERPVQLIWGDRDPFGPPSVGEEAARILRRAEMHVVPGGHAPWLTDPDGVARLVGEFLTGARRAV